MLYAFVKKASSGAPEGAPESAFLTDANDLTELVEYIVGLKDQAVRLPYPESLVGNALALRVEEVVVAVNVVDTLNCIVCVQMKGKRCRRTLPKYNGRSR